MTNEVNLSPEELHALLGEKREQQNQSVSAFSFGELEFEPSADGVSQKQMNLNLLMDIPLQVVVELGRTQKKISDVLELSHGSIVELNKLAGEPVNVLVNNKVIAKGEVVVVDESFGVRITELLKHAL
jgi:flagellar motor switch protein FliN/FliY